VRRWTMLGPQGSGFRRRSGPPAFTGLRTKILQMAPVAAACVLGGIPSA
jgi:hypothetical protein